MTLTPTELPDLVMTVPANPVIAVSSKTKPTPMGSLLASAMRLKSAKVRVTGKPGGAAQPWQDDSWEMYDLVGEQRFLANTLAGRMAQARFYIGTLADDPSDAPDPVLDDEINAILDSIGNTLAGRAQLILRLAINLFITGDGWLCGIPRYLMPDATAEESARAGTLDDVDLADLEWRMLSVSEVGTTAGKKVELKLGAESEEKVEVDPDEVYLIRIWRPHPRRNWEADSPTRASLPVLRELVGLTMHISAQIDSRLAGAGILVVPQSAQSAMKRAAGLPDDSPEDPFTESLIEAMITPINDRAAASAVVPLVVTVPDEVADKFSHLKFSSPLDDQAPDLREESIRRLALGQDAPPELLLGTAGMNHWGAWLVREDVVTTHLEPPLALICDALTTQFLWPVLEAQGMDQAEARRYVFWYDVNHLIARPNRAGDAVTLYDKGELSGDSLRLAHGFDHGDEPKSKAYTIVLDMLKATPALADNPGLPQLIEEVEALLEGRTPPEREKPEPVPAALEEPAPEEPVGEAADDETAAPVSPGEPPKGPTTTGPPDV